MFFTSVNRLKRPGGGAWDRHRDTAFAELRPKVDSFKKAALGRKELNLRVLWRMLIRLKLAFIFILGFLGLRWCSIPKAPRQRLAM